MVSLMLVNFTISLEPWVPLFAEVEIYNGNNHLCTIQQFQTISVDRLASNFEFLDSQTLIAVSSIPKVKVRLHKAI